MVLNKFPLSDSSRLQAGRNFVLVVNPVFLDELFKIAVVTKHAQRLLHTALVSPFSLSLQARILVYSHQILIRDGRVLVRLPQTVDELNYMKEMDSPEIWEVDDTEIEKIAEAYADKIVLSGGNPQERASFEERWKLADNDLSLPARLLGIVKETLAGVLANRNNARGVNYPFPLFRAPFLSVFTGTKKEALDIILERLRQRYVTERNVEKVPTGLVVTTNLDHLRLLIEVENKEIREMYTKAFLQTPDGYPPLMLYGKASLGFQPKELIEGTFLFIQLINMIGNENLPYTIYLAGGFGNVPYKVREYFIAAYPNLKNNFVGISTPPFGFFENKGMLDAIAVDVNAKRPDLLFVGMTAPNGERFIDEMLKRKVNFGIGFNVGRSIEIVAGYQKKEPAMIEKLHLAWIYRMIFGGKGDIKKRQIARVVKDFQFVFKTLFSK